jgi:hypothetical protein
MEAMAAQFFVGHAEDVIERFPIREFLPGWFAWGTHGGLRRPLASGSSLKIKSNTPSWKTLLLVRQQCGHAGNCGGMTVVSGFLRYA